MNIGLWVLQAGLAVIFAMAGFTKGFSPLPELANEMAWVAGVPAWVPRVAGFSELLGVVGLILPAALRIKPNLTPLAAGGLGVVMLLATGLHLMRGELPYAAGTVTLLILCGLVAYGRFKIAPITPRT